MRYHLHYAPGTRYGKRLGRIRMGSYPTPEIAEQARQACFNTDQLEVVDDDGQVIALAEVSA